MSLTVSSFFRYYIFHSNRAPEKNDRILSLVMSVSLGIFSLGIVHLVCYGAFYNRKFKKIYPPGQSEKTAASIFKENDALEEKKNEVSSIDSLKTKIHHHHHRHSDKREKAKTEETVFDDRKTVHKKKKRRESCPHLPERKNTASDSAEEESSKSHERKRHLLHRLSLKNIHLSSFHNKVQDIKASEILEKEKKRNSGSLEKISEELASNNKKKKKKSKQPV